MQGNLLADFEVTQELDTWPRTEDTCTILAGCLEGAHLTENEEAAKVEHGLG